MMFTHVTLLMRDNDGKTQKNKSYISVFDAVCDFLDFWNISPDYYDIDTAKTTYSNMKQKFSFATITDGIVQVKKKF